MIVNRAAQLESNDTAHHRLGVAGYQCVEKLPRLLPVVFTQPARDKVFSLRCYLVAHHGPQRSTSVVPQAAS